MIKKTKYSLLIVLCLFCFLNMRCYHERTEPDPDKDGIVFTYSINLDGYVVDRAYGSGAYEFTVPKVYDDKVNGEKPIKKIGNDSFVDWTWITNVKISSNVIEMGDGCFYNLSNLKSVTFEEPSSLNTIGDSAFEFCDKITELKLPSTLNTIGTETFMYCTRLSKLSFTTNDSAPTLVKIGPKAFSFCEYLSSVNIPKSVNTISRFSFYGCKRLATINFETDSLLEVIGDGAFNGCVSLKTITIPSGVKYIGSEIFDGCTSLTKIIYPGTKEQWDSILKDVQWDKGIPADCVLEFGA